MSYNYIREIRFISSGKMKNEVSKTVKEEVIDVEAVSALEAKEKLGEESSEEERNKRLKSPIQNSTRITDQPQVCRQNQSKICSQL